VHICPSETTAVPRSIVSPQEDPNASWGGGNYVANIQSLNHWWHAKANKIQQPRPFTHPKFSHITDGTSKTVSFAERYAVCPTPHSWNNGRTHWLGTPATQYDSVFAWNRQYTAHAGAMNVLMLDGSVQSIAGDIDLAAWKLSIFPRDDGVVPPTAGSGGGPR
jgi:prepilin-type processing-associated H-X9-DG protein